LNLHPICDIALIYSHSF